MADRVQIIMGLLGTFFALFILYLLVAGSVTLVLYSRVGQGTKGGFWYTDRDKLKKYIFKSWIDWAGRPSTFSYAPSADVLYSSTYKTITGNNISDCMMSCESANERGKTPKCVGFIYHKGSSSNTCILTSTMDGLTTDRQGTSNTIYFIDGLDTARQYKVYNSNTQANLTYFEGTPYDSGGSTPEYTAACASNCASMTDCTGVVFTGFSGGTSTHIMCGLVKDGLDPTKFTLDNNSKIALFIPHFPLNSSSLEYWASS